ncbi:MULTISPECIES: lipid A biosynthesis lauroyl acyltransferase [unclassified Cupriavidus]|uniref:lipid A biosynthesis lauroyl acyltransferase n=1 Tax=unclassified Cupriavidus TaxID=2640874 RepID=UPI001F0C320E|nr:MULTISPECIES: lipid A biosynthesis lauroyl acyltransferase [unclassified Cupriavidus]
MSRIFTSLGIGLLTLLGKLPYSFVARFGEALGSLLYRIPSSRREVVRANLRLCFPEKSAAEIEAMSHETFRKVFRSLAEGGIFWTCGEDKMRRLVQIDDQANLPALDGTPHILVTPHLSGLEAGAIRLTMHLRDTVGRSGASLYTVQKNELFDNFLKVARGRFGANMISRNDSARSILRVLKQGEALQLISDMDFGPRDSEFIPFFGAPALTLTVVSRLARASGAQVVPIYTEQLPDYKGYVLHILPAWDNYPGESVTEDTRRMNQFFEDAIRPRVADYYWVHKRFKHRPPGEPDIY